MTKAELIDRIHQELGEELTKRMITRIVDATFEGVKESVRGDGKFSYPNFGILALKERKARNGHNPATGEALKIPAGKTVAFKPAPGFRESL